MATTAHPFRAHHAPVTSSVLHKCRLNVFMTDELYYYFHFTDEEQTAEKGCGEAKDNRNHITGALGKSSLRNSHLNFILGSEMELTRQREEEGEHVSSVHEGSMGHAHKIQRRHVTRESREGGVMMRWRSLVQMAS